MGICGKEVARNMRSYFKAMRELFRSLLDLGGNQGGGYAKNMRKTILSLAQQWADLSPHSPIVDSSSLLSSLGNFAFI
jgi:hypothetical protein